ncbi:MAG TPA: hypothetical protein PLF13_05640 [candidate division Zixibacteria bacterium]|nr:hypothetical protein [candidate division Zixibacteria bacterium]
MSVRKTMESAQLGIVTGAMIYIGFELTGLVLDVIHQYLRP